jgi:hypothetical protein
MPECFATAGVASFIVAPVSNRLRLEQFRLLPYVDLGEGTDNPKSAQEPQDNNNDHNNVQDRFDGARHGDETVDEPEKNANHNKDYHYMD